MVLDQFGNIFVADAYLGILAISSDGSSVVAADMLYSHLNRYFLASNTS